MATSPVSIAANSSAQAAGGSVIDVNSLVSQLVASARAPKDAVISQQTQAVTTQISALGTLKGRPINLPGLTERDRYSLGLQRRSREHQQQRGIHSNGELRCDSGQLQHQRDPTGQRAAAGIKGL
jgi:hypothetical protein